MSTEEGYQYTDATGLTAGLPCSGVVRPLTHRTQVTDHFDVIVVGAGYAGLIAARDLAIQRKKVLLLEARDRIGGRTWTSEIEGFPFEMGGTWINWKQPHVYAEVTRYAMQDQLLVSQDYTKDGNYFTLITDGKSRNMTHEEEGDMYEKALGAFCNVDGQMGRVAMPFPHNPTYNKEAYTKWDKLSARQRIDQIKSRLSRDEIAVIESMVVHISGGTLDNTGFWDILRWWALCEYKADGISEYGLAYKFKCGQSGFAQEIFSEAKRSGSLSYHFLFPVAAIKQTKRKVEVTGRNGQSFFASRLISTLPLNVLSDVQFEPSLSTLKVQAAKEGHVDLASKVHCELKNSDLRSWSGCAYPGKGLLYAYGDGETPAGTTHIVAFGAQAEQLHPEQDIEKTKAALTHIHDMDIGRLVFHNWTRDEFAKGAWCVFRPGFSSKYLAALQSPEGRVRFASADWAHGWRGFIDGAIEQGARAAVLTAQDLAMEYKSMM